MKDERQKMKDERQKMKDERLRNFPFLDVWVRLKKTGCFPAIWSMTPGFQKVGVLCLLSKI